MKRFLMIAATFLLILVLLAGCSKSQTESPIGTEPSVSPTTLTAQRQTASAGKPAEETTPAETEEDAEHSEDPSSYSIDVVYTQQIERYYTAVSQQWDQYVYWDHEMSPMVAYYYDGTPLDNVGFTFLDLDSDGVRELIIGGSEMPHRTLWCSRSGQ